MPLTRSRLLHGAGLLLLGLAWSFERALAAVEAGHTGPEPTSA